MQAIYFNTYYKMKRLHILLVASFCLLFSACFKDEALNTECDIEEAYVHVDTPEETFFSLTDTLVKVLSDNSSVVFKVRKTADLTHLAPVFKITEGATIEPASGSVHDFSGGPVTYTVTSQDGNWSRVYSVSFRPSVQTVADVLKFDFERYYLDPSSKYYIWNDVKEDGSNADNWATGNAGFMLSKGDARPDEYPTVPWADGYDGTAVKLETLSTGPLGVIVGKRIAAGNLFLGSFDLGQALTNALKATRFGLPFDRKPLKFRGYYKYMPGERFQDEKGNIVEGRTDRAAVYSVLYRNHDAAGNSVVLYGDDVMTSPNIVAVARVENVAPASEWTPFEVDFAYREDIDNSLVNENGYSLAVVFSSSEDGDLFKGAIGSKLFIDKVSIECEKIEE